MSSHGDYEKTDAHAKPTIIFLVVMAVFTLSCFAAGLVFFKVFQGIHNKAEGSGHPMAASRNQTPPEPRLQVYEAKDLKAFMHEQNSHLETYGWVNESAGIVRVPVDRAMDLVLKDNEIPSSVK